MSKTCEKRYGVKYYVITQRFKGEQSPRWKGGVSKLRNERYQYEYIAWRKSVFIRDKYICQCCGAQNGNGLTVVLNAHHIRNWKDNESCRYDINNGITLCDKCHCKFHSLYGKKNTTKEQLDSFILSYGKKIC